MPEKNLEEFCIMEGSWRICSCCQISWIYPARISVAPSPSASWAFFIAPSLLCAPTSASLPCSGAVNPKPGEQSCLFSPWMSVLLPQGVKKGQKMVWNGCWVLPKPRWAPGEAVPTLQRSTAAISHSPAHHLSNKILSLWGCFAWAN